VKKAMFIPFILGLLVACTSGVSALSGADAERLSALEVLAAQQTTQIAALQEAMTSLKSQVDTFSARPRPAVFVQAPRAANVSALKFGRTSSASTSECTGLGTLTGRPDSSNPITSNLLAGVSCTGYVYVMTQAATAADHGLLQSLPVASLFWTSSDCTGPAYVSPNYAAGSLSGGVFVNGVVFRRTGSPAAPTDPNDASTYLYVPANAPGVTVTPGSFINRQTNTETCVSYAAFTVPPQPVDAAVQVLVNDPVVTGLPSEPIAGPIVIGTTG
jgi:hypothetical protein